ncbi:MAG TPA: enoyl-CoA hydratase/isomerase family protein [Acidimicrobiales bacterium]|nr:enoyl-CoA hydratase/isomerase family protein [Acidimicrobiales bacterium]
MTSSSSEAPGILSASDALALVEGGLAPEAIGALGDRPMLAIAVDDDPMLSPLAEVVRPLPCVTVGVARAGADLSAPPDFDILLAEAVSPERPWVGCADIDQELALVTSTVAQGSGPAIALAQLLRFSAGISMTDALVSESFVYSLLQSGPIHRQWIDRRGPVRHRDQSEPTVLAQRQSSSLLLTLNRPQVRNAYDARMRDELVAMLQVAAVDPTISSIALTGAGPSFCSGGDLSEFGSVPDPVSAHLIRTTQSAAPWLVRCGSRTTAIVHGACVGAGTELPAFVAQVVARPDATFQLPEVPMGLIPGAGGTVSLPRRIGRQRTAFMAITGSTIDAATALAWHLVDRIEPAP